MTTQRMMAEKEFFTMIPNEMLEKVCRSHFSSLEIELILVVVRKIYGWHKETGMDPISLSQFCEFTRRTKEGVRKALKRLEEKEVLIRALPHTGRRSTVWAINTDYDSWKVVEVNARSTLEHKKRVNGRSTLQGEKEAENELENVASDPRGEQPFHPGVNERSSVEVRRGEQPLPHKRNGSKETILKESENGSSRTLINLIQTQLRETMGDEALELSKSDLDTVQTVSEKFPDQTPESLFHSFKNVLGTSDDPLAAISQWAENVGKYLPTSNRKEKGFTSMRSKLAALEKRLR